MAERRTPVVIIGAGGYAGTIYDMLAHRADVLVVGCTDKTLGLSERSHSDHTDLRILGDETILPDLKEQYPDLHAVLALGPALLDVRGKVINTLMRQGIDLFTVVHRGALISDRATLGSGTVVQAGAVVSPNVSTGPNCILSLGSTIDHDVKIGANCFVGQGAHIASYVEIHNNVVVEIGAQINRRVEIADSARIMGGAFVNTDVPPHAVIGGVPGRVIRYEE